MKNYTQDEYDLNEIYIKLITHKDSCPTVKACDFFIPPKKFLQMFQEKMSHYSASTKA